MEKFLILTLLFIVISIIITMLVIFIVILPANGEEITDITTRSRSFRAMLGDSSALRQMDREMVFKL